MKAKAILRLAFAPVVEAGSGDVSMAEPFTIQTDLSAASGIPEPEVRHTASPRPTRM